MKIVDSIKIVSAKEIWNLKELLIAFGEKGNGQQQIRSLISHGFLKRVKRDLYVSINQLTLLPYANQYVIACNIALGAYLFGESVFAYHGYENQASRAVYVCAPKRFRNVTFEDYDYLYVRPRINIGMSTNAEGVSLCYLERAFLDLLAVCNSNTALEQLLNYLFNLTYLDEALLLELLPLYRSAKLYSKAGYILEFFKQRLGLSDSFFGECQKGVGESRCYFGGMKSVFCPAWNIYAPKDPLYLVRKGGFDDPGI